MPRSLLQCTLICRHSTVARLYCSSLAAAPGAKLLKLLIGMHYHFVEKQPDVALMTLISCFIAMNGSFAQSDSCMRPLRLDRVRISAVLLMTLLMQSQAYKSQRASPANHSCWTERADHAGEKLGQQMQVGLERMPQLVS